MQFRAKMIPKRSPNDGGRWVVLDLPEGSTYCQVYTEEEFCVVLEPIVNMLKVKITRTSTDRMTDMYVLRFPGHQNRSIAFTRKDWEESFTLRLPRGGSTSADLEVQEDATNH